MISGHKSRHLPLRHNHGFKLKVG